MAGRSESSIQHPEHIQWDGASPRALVAVQVFPPYRRRVSQTWLLSVAQVAFDSAGEPWPLSDPPRQWEIELVIADDDTVRDLNRRYRGLDEVTDVLAFSPLHGGHFEGPDEPPEQPEVSFPDIGLEAESLGQVIIAFPQAERQALQAGATLKQEVAALIVHGILHLLGHDHLDPHEEKQMLALQQATLKRVPLDG